MADFATRARESGLLLPLSVGHDGGIVDADGDEIATVDVNRQLVDAEAEAIQLLIVEAVNAAGGCNG